MVIFSERKHSNYLLSICTNAKPHLQLQNKTAETIKHHNMFSNEVACKKAPQPYL